MPNVAANDARRAMPTLAERRMAPRFPCMLSANWRPRDGDGWRQGWVQNLCSAGAALLLGARPAPGTILLVEIWNGAYARAREARVVHNYSKGRRETVTGCAFLVPLDPSELEALLASPDSPEISRPGRDPAQ